MARPRSLKSLVAFNAGEMTPTMGARSDTEKYQNGCRTLRNMLPMIQGGAMRRRGFEYIATAKSNLEADKARMLRFQFSHQDTYTIEAGNLYFRFYRRGVQIISGTPYEVVTPYTAAECFELQFCQIEDVMIFTHPNHPPYKLIRLADDNWTMAVAILDLPPFLDENTTAVTLTPSAVTGSGITVTASATTFLAGHVGSYWRVRHLRVGTYQEVTLAATATSAAIEVNGAWTLNSYKTATTFGGTVELQTSPDNSTWTTIRSYHSNADAIFADDGDTDGETLFMRLKATVVTGDAAARFMLRVPDQVLGGLVKITGFTSTTVVTADVIHRLNNTTATTRWAEGAFSAVRGYPTGCCFFQQRLWFAGTAYEPQKMWGSKIAGYFDFTLGTDDDDGIAFTLADVERNQILCMLGQKKLVIPTSGGVTAAYGDELEAAITATKPPLVLKQNNIAAAYLRAVLVNGAIIFVQQNLRKVREMVFDGSQGVFTAEDLTALASHITAGGIITPCYQGDRDSIYWACTGLGRLIGMTYEKSQNVIAWHRHDTAGIFESCETVYGENGTDDEIWVSVRRLINGSWVRYIERMRGYYQPSVDTELDQPVAKMAGNAAQLAILVDVGAGMGLVLAALVAQIDEIAADFADSYTSVTFAGIAFKNTAPDRVVQDFTDIVTFKAWLAALTSSGGAAQEDGFGTIVAAETALTWSVGQSKHVILVSRKTSLTTLATYKQALASLVALSAYFSYTTTEGAASYGPLATARGGVAVSLAVMLARTFPEEYFAGVLGYSGKMAEAFFVDSGKSYFSHPAATAFLGVPNLAGMAVDVLADGNWIQGITVGNGFSDFGRFTLPIASKIVHIGLPYETELQPMRIDNDAQQGSGQGLIKRIHELVFRLMDSGGARIATGPGGTPVVLRLPAAVTGGELMNGDVKHPYQGDYNEDATFVLKSLGPQPLTVLGVFVKYTVTENP